MAEIYNEEAFNKEVVERKERVLIDFYADWCGPCKMMAPIIESISQKYKDKIKVGKINIDDYAELASTYNVMSIPTLILFEEGQQSDIIVGAVPESQVEEMLQKYV